MLKNLINFIASRNDASTKVYTRSDNSHAVSTFTIQITRNNKRVEDVVMYQVRVLSDNSCYLSIQTREQASNDSGSIDFEGDAEEITSILLCNYDFKQLASDFCGSEDYPVVEAYSKLLAIEGELETLREQVAEIESGARCYAEECDFDDRENWMDCDNSKF